jgi:adhesin transport system membrane fusion protein
MARDRDLERLAREMRGRSPLRGSILLFTILAFLLTAVIWAANTEIDDVTRADGRIVPSASIQVIEASEPGVLEALHVSEGEVVEQGALLMELDGTILDSQLDQEQQRAYGLMARIERLQSEIDETPLRFSPDLVARAADVVKSETALYRGRQVELQAEIDILERQRLQRRQEYEEGLVDRQTAQETLAVLTEERDIMAPLVERGMEPATTLLSLRRTEAEWRGREVREGVARTAAGRARRDRRPDRCPAQPVSQRRPHRSGDRHSRTGRTQAGPAGPPEPGRAVAHHRPRARHRQPRSPHHAGQHGPLRRRADRNRAARRYAAGRGLCAPRRYRVSLSRPAGEGDDHRL